MGARSSKNTTQNNRSDGHLLEYFRNTFVRGGGANSGPTIPPFNASGGNLADGLAPGNGYKYHTFSGTGTFTTNLPANLEIMILAGGGGGGDAGGGAAGGGGAGGLRYYSSLNVSAGSYPISVGAGGAGAPDYLTPGSPGGNTTAFGKSATGGGHRNYPDTPSAWKNGGSGSGIYGTSSPTASPDPDSSPTGEGFPGGPGGGGGAGEAGQPNRGGNGRQFPQFSGPLIGVPALNPLSAYFGGGGGCGFESSPSTPGGLGGGGNGASRYPPLGIVSTEGVQYSGGGGGGSSTSGTALAKAGGSGLVVIRYPVAI